MGKYSNFDRVEKDFYPTIDPDAIPQSLIEWIYGTNYAEPCYGNGDLEDALMEIAHCKWRSDIRRTVESSKVMDAVEIGPKDVKDCDLIITNPPYKRDVLLPLLDHFLTLKPTWLLLPADMMHNKYMSKYLDHCLLIISVGRLYWQENKVKGKGNFCWFQFDSYWTHGPRFIGR